MAKVNPYPSNRPRPQAAVQRAENTGGGAAGGLSQLTNLGASIQNFALGMEQSRQTREVSDTRKRIIEMSAKAQEAMIKNKDPQEYSRIFKEFDEASRALIDNSSNQAVKDKLNLFYDDFGARTQATIIRDAANLEVSVSQQELSDDLQDLTSTAILAPNFETFQESLKAIDASIDERILVLGEDAAKALKRKYREEAALGYVRHQAAVDPEALAEGDPKRFGLSDPSVLSVYIAKGREKKRNLDLATKAAPYLAEVRKLEQVTASAMNFDEVHGPAARIQTIYLELAAMDYWDDVTPEILADKIFNAKSSLYFSAAHNILLRKDNAERAKLMKAWESGDIGSLNKMFPDMSGDDRKRLWSAIAGHIANENVENKKALSEAQATVVAEIQADLRSDNKETRDKWTIERLESMTHSPDGKTPSKISQIDFHRLRGLINSMKGREDKDYASIQRGMKFIETPNNGLVQPSTYTGDIDNAFEYQIREQFGNSVNPETRMQIIQQGIAITLNTGYVPKAVRAMAKQMNAKELKALATAFVVAPESDLDKTSPVSRASILTQDSQFFALLRAYNKNLSLATGQNQEQEALVKTIAQMTESVNDEEANKRYKTLRDSYSHFKSKTSGELAMMHTFAEEFTKHLSNTGGIDEAVFEGGEIQTRHLPVTLQMEAIGMFRQLAADPLNKNATADELVTQVWNHISGVWGTSKYSRGLVRLAPEKFGTVGFNTILSEHELERYAAGLPFSFNEASVTGSFSAGIGDLRNRLAAGNHYTGHISEDFADNGLPALLETIKGSMGVRGETTDIVTGMMGVAKEWDIKYEELMEKAFPGKSMAGHHQANIYEKASRALHSYQSIKQNMADAREGGYQSAYKQKHLNEAASKMWKAFDDLRAFEAQSMYIRQNRAAAVQEFMSKHIKLTPTEIGERQVPNIAQIVAKGGKTGVVYHMHFVNRDTGERYTIKDPNTGKPAVYRFDVPRSALVAKILKGWESMPDSVRNGVYPNVENTKEVTPTARDVIMFLKMVEIGKLKLSGNEFVDIENLVDKEGNFNE